MIIIKRLLISIILIGLIGLCFTVYKTNSSTDDISRLRALTSIDRIYGTSKYFEYNDRLNDYMLYKKLYIAGIVISVMLISVSTFSLVATKKQRNNKKTTEKKLEELQSLLSKKLITDDDYIAKKDEIIKNL